MKIKQLVFPEKNRVELQDAELDSPLKDGEILVRTRKTLVSAGTELAMFTRTHRGFDEPGNTYAKYPFYPGYLAVGEVLESKSPQFKPGQRAFTATRHATIQKTDAARSALIPDELSDERAAFLGLIRVSSTSIHLAPPKFGAQVVVIGMGIVGNLCAQLYAQSGAGRVAGADLAETRLARARDCGIEERFLVSSSQPLTEHVKEFGPRGADIIVEAVGNSLSIDAALKSVARRGQVVLLGSPRKRMEIDPYYDIHSKGVTLIGAHATWCSDFVRYEMSPVYLRWIVSGRLKVDPLITHRMPLESAAKAYEGLRDNPNEYIGVILEFPKA